MCREFVVGLDDRDYWGEWDVTYGDVDIVGKQPLSDAVAGMLWFAWFRDVDYRRVEGMGL